MISPIRYILISSIKTKNLIAFVGAGIEYKVKTVDVNQDIIHHRFHILNMVFKIVYVYLIYKFISV